MREKAPGLVVSAAAVGIALVHVFDREGRWNIDTTTLVLLVLAAVPWLFPFLKSLTLPGGTVVEFREKLREVERKVDVIEDSGRLPGRPEPAPEKPRGSFGLAAAAVAEWSTDPNKGKFGGQPQANGRALEAKIEPAAGPSSAACHVALGVRSSDPARPLTGAVTFHLHPTFGSHHQYEVPVVGGIAATRLTSWGVFTVGAVADGGETRLELDLLDVEGGTPRFYSQ